MYQVTVRLLRLRSQGFPPLNSCAPQQFDSILTFHSTLADQQGLKHHQVDREVSQVLRIQIILVEEQESVDLTRPVQADQNLESFHLVPIFVLQWL